MKRGREEGRDGERQRGDRKRGREGKNIGRSAMKLYDLLMFQVGCHIDIYLFILCHCVRVPHCQLRACPSQPGRQPPSRPQALERIPRRPPEDTHDEQAPHTQRSTAAFVSSSSKEQRQSAEFVYFRLAPGDTSESIPEQVCRARFV